jgi:hypothetical protein
VCLRAHAVADQGHLGACGQLTVELNGEGIHRDCADHPAELAVDAHLGPGQVAPETVRVADGNEADPRRSLGDEAAPVAGALARLQELDLREVALPPKHGLEIVVGGIRHEWRQTVDRDPAACGVEPGFRQAQRGGAVGDVTLERAAVGLHELRETRRLLPRERGVGLRGRQVAHHPTTSRVGDRSSASP